MANTFFVQMWKIFMPDKIQTKLKSKINGKSIGGVDGRYGIMQFIRSYLIFNIDIEQWAKTKRDTDMLSGQCFCMWSSNIRIFRQYHSFSIVMIHLFIWPLSINRVQCVQCSYIHVRISFWGLKMLLNAFMRTILVYGIFVHKHVTHFTHTRTHTHWIKILHDFYMTNICIRNLFHFENFLFSSDQLLIWT